MGPLPLLFLAVRAMDMAISMPVLQLSHGDSLCFVTFEDRRRKVILKSALVCSKETWGLFADYILSGLSNFFLIVIVSTFIVLTNNSPSAARTLFLGQEDPRKSRQLVTIHNIQLMSVCHFQCCRRVKSLGIQL